MSYRRLYVLSTGYSSFPPLSTKLYQLEMSRRRRYVSIAAMKRASQHSVTASAVGRLLTDCGPSGPRPVPDSVPSQSDRRFLFHFIPSRLQPTTSELPTNFVQSAFSSTSGVTLHVELATESYNSRCYYIGVHELALTTVDSSFSDIPQ